MFFDVLKSILDIALTAFIIYGILFFLKGTKAGEIAFGFMCLLLIYLLSDFFGLASLNWLLGGFVANFLLIIVIVFHPDIRRLLGTLGERARLKSSAPPQSSKIIGEVIKAVMAMSEKKIGGIIVFEGNIKLDDLVDIGIKMDAEVSKELLLSIFSPQSPIHDGAVIIRNERIAIASCFLPMTKNPHLEKTFGSRHRAGIGITEETDAIAIIASEETGKISLAKGGMLMIELDETKLRKEISSHFKI